MDLNVDLDVDGFGLGRFCKNDLMQIALYSFMSTFTSMSMSRSMSRSSTDHHTDLR